MTHVRDERHKQTVRAIMFDCLFKQQMIFIDEVLKDRDNYVEKERAALLLKISDIKREMQIKTDALKEQAKTLTEKYEQQIADLKKQLQAERDQKEELQEIIKDQNYQLNGLFNIERRTETYENIKRDLWALEAHIKESEEERKVHFEATSQVMSFINIGGMAALKVDKGLQAGNSCLPLNTEFEPKHTLSHFVQSTSTAVFNACQSLQMVKPSRCET